MTSNNNNNNRLLMQHRFAGLLVAAAFIGPGTVTTATLAGAHFGYSLVWALVFSIFATMVLQEMAARLGIITGLDLTTAVRNSLPGRHLPLVAMLLIIAAIGLGNAAYEAGNITGAALGLTNITPLSHSQWSLTITGVAAVLILTGRFRLMQTVLVGMVMLMSLLFIITMWLAKPDWQAIWHGATHPTPNSAELTTIMALIGTTVVPYNLFMHTSLVREKNINRSHPAGRLSTVRWDSNLAILLGGFVTLAIFSTAASSFFNTGINVTGANMASQLQPLLGDHAQWLFAVGLFAAGLTSAITAPLAAGYALCSALGLSATLKDWGFRIICLLVLFCGGIFASVGIKPLSAIIFAQAANGLLLPLIAIFLLWVMNQYRIMADYRNGWLSNIAGIGVVAAVSSLSIYKLINLL